MITEPEDLIKEESTNAQEWAQMFIKTKKENNWTIKDIDEGLMIAWFANAIEVAKLKEQR